ncbi:hypothetical protein IL38_02725 [Actinopolyspora erythraea]|uniref:DUF6802 domain-containing protein n=1 Tax=Actinopolyspora erythraea TaxID=414996 RepID=A0ABR4X8Q2_9ACTN|nr:DUF6802 family protein [Actinopolyspora erythraea]KGI82805.1 hypothetical protein IL38_02725 [Actinopolyspora erythraea]
MYVEDTSSGDGDIRIDIADSEYTAEANYDLDDDGVDETVAVMADGGFLAYTDSDDDGEADVMRAIDERGEVVEQARLDESSGEWVRERPDGSTIGEPGEEADGRSMVVDTPQGDREVGPPTEDTNNDGRADTAIVDTEHGQMMVTDANGDGSADQMVEISDSGEVTVAEHTGDGEWTVVEQGRVDGRGQYAPEEPTSRVSGTEDWLWNDEEREGTNQGPSAPDPADDSYWV